jgi:hypothetical protein
MKAKPAAYYLLLLALLFQQTGCRRNVSKVKLPRMAETYSYKDKFPLGLNVAQRFLKTQFEYAPLKVTTQSFDKEALVLGAYDSSTIYFIVTKNLIPDKDAVTSMLNYVSRGNTLFIAAEYIDSSFTQKLGIKITDYGWLKYITDNDSSLLMQDVNISLTDSIWPAGNKFGFYFNRMEQYITAVDTPLTHILGGAENGMTNFVCMNYGSGRIFIHSNPLVFSNYFLLTKNNHRYFENVISYLQPRPIIDYYRNSHYSGNAFFSLQVFFKYPALKWALLLGMGLLLLYVAFAGKRKQRPVPTLQPNINSSVSFVQTVGLLYLQKKDNRNIALKMATYFYEHVRSHYFIATNTINDEFVKILSRKSGVSETRVNELTLLFDEINNMGQISDLELLDLHNRIQEFYKQ